MDVSIHSEVDPLEPARRNYVIRGSREDVQQAIDILENQPHTEMKFVTAAESKTVWCARGYMRQDIRKGEGVRGDY